MFPFGSLAATRPMEPATLPIGNVARRKAKLLLAPLAN
jgi:hypothetical protein